MRLLISVSLVCAWASIVGGQDRKPTVAEQRAIDALDGRSLVARVYLNPQTDPERFEKISLPVAGGRIRFSSIKSSCPSISDASVVFIGARDQAEPAAADALGRHVFMSRYFANDDPRLAFLASKNEYSPYWTFIDAQGEPIPNASIEVAACAVNAMGDIPLYKAMSDERGRLSRLIGPMFILKVEHPNYGIATVMYMNQEEDPCGVYVVPLVPRDCEAFASSIQGSVIDSDGSPIPGVTVTCSDLIDSNGVHASPYDGLYKLTYGRAVTDAKGWFALCLPVVTKDAQWKGLPSPGTQYFVEVEPPKASNFRGPEKFRPVPVLAGSERTFTLAKMDTQEFFRTFAFEYQEGPVTRLEDFKDITLTLMRDDREWRTLSYEQWKNGCSLPTGLLRASSKRWGNSFGFPPVELTVDSPEHVVIKAAPLITYQGTVVDAVTGKPLPGVLVLSGHRYAREDPCSFTPDRWRQLRDEAARQTDLPARGLYEWHDRVAATDAEGNFTVAFMPGFNDRLYSFTAMVPGYERANESGGTLLPVDGFAMIQTFRLSPLKGKTYLPVFIFEDETGPVTDPARLNAIKFEIKTDDNYTHVPTYERLMSQRQFIPGVYSAEVAWDRKYYTFEPVDLTRDRPATVTFRPAKIEKADVIYEGIVVHGITGKPMANVIILHRRLGGQRDASSLTMEQWAAIDALGPQIDPNNPALTPLMSTLVPAGPPAGVMVPRLTKTDANGCFALPAELAPSTRDGEILAVARDFLAACQQLAPLLPPEGDAPGPRRRHRLEADDKGIVSLPPMKLFPAATVLVHPVLPDPGSDDRRQRVRLQWRIPGDDRPSWAHDLLDRGRQELGAGSVLQYDVQPNMTQTLYVPAGVNMGLTLQVFRLMEAPVPPVHVPNVRLEQGQVRDLGRLEFRPGLQVAVKVVDSAGVPAVGVPVSSAFEDDYQWAASVATDAQGIAMCIVPFHSWGRLRVIRFDRQTRMMSEESTPYAVAGEEDAGKEFVLTLSDDFLQRVREALAERSSTAPASRMPGRR